MVERWQSLLARLAFALAASGAAHAQLELPDKPVEHTEPAREIELKQPPRGNQAKNVVPAKNDGTDTSRANQRLDLPASGSVAAPAPAPAPVAAPPAPAPIEPLPSSAAAFVLGEVRKVRELSSELLPRAVESLTRMGDQGREAARVALAEDHGPSVMVGARVLLGTGRADDADYLLQRMHMRLPTAVCAALVDTLVAQDPVRASPQFLLELLAHPQSAVRNAAQRHLEGRGNELPLTSLAALCNARESDTRVRALQLTQRNPDPQATAILIDRLADASPLVARQAVSALALRDDDRIDAELVRRAFARNWILRSECYALLAIIEREDRSPRAILEVSHTEKLLAGLDSKEPFVAGTCAAALAGVGFRASDPTQTPWLDLEVPHRLIRVVAAEDFTPDYAALAEVAARRLALITGKMLGSDGPAWITWWTAEANSFHACRAALAARVEDAPTLRVGVISNAEPAEAFTLLGPAFAESPAGAGDAALRGETSYLSDVQARSLYEVLREQAVFSATRLPGLRGTQHAVGRTLTVEIAGGEKSVRFAGVKSEDWFERSIEAARALRERNRWQRYADGEKYATPLALWRADRDWWDEPHSEAERERRLADLVLAYLVRKPPLERDAGVAELERIAAASGVLSSSDVSALLVLVRGERFTGARATSLVELTIRCGRDAGPPESAPLNSTVADELVRALLETFAADAGELASRVLRAAGRDVARRYASAPEPLLRAIAAATLARGATEADTAVLMKLLADPVDEVEAATVLALGENKIEAARTELLLRARVGKPTVRPNALFAVGMLGGPEVLDVLLAGLSQRDDPKVYIGAVRGLATMHDAQAVPLLVSLISKGTEDPAYAYARRGLIELGPAAWPDLLRVVRAPGHRARREAALILSEQCAPDAASALMTILTETRADAHVAEELCVLTCVDKRGEIDPARAWWDWWEYVVHDDAQAWFCGALARLGAVASTPEALRAGERDAFDFVFDVLQRDEAFLVERARRELTRMLGRDIGAVPPSGPDRRAWIATLREFVAKRRE